MIKHIHERLRIWSEWVRNHPSRYAALGFPSKSAEARLMRTAPGAFTLSGLPQARLCTDCGHRQSRYGSTISICIKCGSDKLIVPENVVHGHEQQARRMELIDDNPEAELTDRAIAAMAINQPNLREAIMIRYLRQYSLPLTAQYLHVSLTVTKAWLDQAHCWIDGWLMHVPRKIA